MKKNNLKLTFILLGLSISSVCIILNNSSFCRHLVSKNSAKSRF